MPKKIRPLLITWMISMPIDRADDRAGAARERRAADDHRGDDREHEVRALIRVDGAAEADIHRARKAADRAHQHQRLQPHAARLEMPASARRLRIAADRLDAIAEAGAVEDEMHDDGEHDEDQRRHRHDAEDLASRSP